MGRPHTARIALLCLVILVSVSYILTPVEGTRVQTTNIVVQPSITMLVLGAEYADVDGDLVLNDAIVWFDIHLSRDVRYTLTLYLKLTLPSGMSYQYTYIIITSLNTLHCTMYFYDHAIESGDYLFSATGVLHGCGQDVSIVHYLFDPPGGSGDIDPCGKLVVAA